MKKKKIAVIGAGNSGLAMAAFLTYHGQEVYLWNRSSRTIEALLKHRIIHFDGIMEGESKIHLITDDLGDALSDVELILITTPANSHKEIALKMSRFLSDESLVVLNPGRTFGVMEFEQAIGKTNPSCNATVAETQSIVFTCRKASKDRVSIYSLKNRILLSAMDAKKNLNIIQRLPECLGRFFSPAKSIIETSLGNVGMILHCAPVLLNTGWIEYPGVNFKYYYNGITKSIANLLEKLDEERIETAARFGFPIEPLVEWLNRNYQVKKKTIFDSIQAIAPYQLIDAPTSLNHRYIYEDIPTGLVPMESVGKALGIEVKYTSLIVDLANAVLGMDFRKKGRNLMELGLGEMSSEQLKTFFHTHS